MALIAGARFDRLPKVKPVLVRVKAGALPFDKAMDELSNLLDDKEFEEPRLLLDGAGRPLLENALPQ